MLNDYLLPFDSQQLGISKTGQNSQLFNSVKFFQGKQELDLSSFDLAFIGVPEDRELMEMGTARAPKAIREKFYSLYNWEPRFSMIDMGDIIQGESRLDSCHALAAVVRELLLNGVVPVIVGGTHDLTYGQYMGFDELSRTTNVVTVDERIDLDQPGDEITADSFLFNLFAHQPNYLGNYMQLGYQNYLVDPIKVETIERLGFDCFRLGYIRTDFRRFEPLVRDAHMISFDVSSIRLSDAPGQRNGSPNGLLPEEACMVARYAGISDNLQSFGLYEYYTEKDRDGATSELLAQVLWHFVDGFYARKQEKPESHSRDYITYQVSLEHDGHEIEFVKSLRSDRWWMKIPVANEEGTRPYRLIPCSIEEYEEACRQEIPSRWVNALLKYSSDEFEVTE